MKYIILIATLTSLTSCSVSKTKLSEEGEKVKVTYTKPNKKKCHAIATAVGENENGILDLAINHAINLVAKEGANTLYINDKVNNSNKWRVHGTGYKCKR
jgi:hypothetical protein